MATATKRFRRKLQELETILEAEYPCDHGQAPHKADWAWILDLAGAPREAPQTQDDDDDEDQIPIQQFQPRTPTRSASKQTSASVQVLSRERKESSPPLQAPDDAPFAQFSLIHPRPAFHPYLTATPKWMLAARQVEREGESAEDVRVDACDDSMPSVVMEPNTSKSDAAQVSGAPTDIGISEPTASRAVDHNRDETHTSLPPATTNTKSISTPSAGPTHTTTGSVSDPPDSVPLSPGTRRTMERKKLQKEMQQKRNDQPFEMEIDLTDPSLSVSNATNSAENNDVPHNATTIQHTTPAPLLTRIDFADMTAFTTPGDDDGDDDSDSDTPRTPNKKRKQGVTLRPYPPRPSRKRVITPSIARDDHPPPSRISNQAAVSSLPDTDASLTESHSDTDSESEPTASVADAQPTRRRTTTAASKGSAPMTKTTATTSRPTLTLTLSAALQQEREAAKRRRIEVPADKIDRLRGQEKHIRARKRRDATSRPTEEEAATNARQKLLLSSAAPTTLPSRRTAPPVSDNNTKTSKTNNGTSSNVAAKRTTRRNVPIKKPNWSNMADCLSSWSKWTDEGRQVQKGTQLFHDFVFLLVGTWDKAMAAWIERLIVRGASIVPCYPHEKQHTITHLVSIGIPRAPRKVDCERSLKIDALEDLNRGSGGTATKFVTQEWIMQCISEERIVTEDDPRWKLV